MRVHTVSARCAAALVASVAGAASWEHIASVGLAHGERPWVAWSMPLAVDGLIIVGVSAIMADRAAGLRPRRFARVAILAGVVATLAANVASAEPDPVARAFALAPPVAFLLSVEVLTRSGRRVAPIGATSSPAQGYADGAPGTERASDAPASVGAPEGERFVPPSSVQSRTVGAPDGSTTVGTEGDRGGTLRDSADQRRASPTEQPAKGTREVSTPAPEVDIVNVDHDRGQPRVSARSDLGDVGATAPTGVTPVDGVGTTDTLTSREGLRATQTPRRTSAPAIAANRPDITPLELAHEAGVSERHARRVLARTSANGHDYLTT